MPGITEVLAALQDRLRRIEEHQESRFGDIPVKGAVVRGGMGGRERRVVPLEHSRDVRPPGSIEVDGRVYMPAGSEDVIRSEVNVPTPLHLLRKIPVERAEAIRRSMQSPIQSPAAQRVLEETGTDPADVSTITPGADQLSRVREMLRNERIRQRLAERFSAPSPEDPIQAQARRIR